VSFITSELDVRDGAGLGNRRGAMATLRIDHPDVLEFIDAKRDPSALRFFNLSVQSPSAFSKPCAMNRGGSDIPGIRRPGAVLPARELDPAPRVELRNVRARRAVRRR
jgi:ribonucleotide reductase alpha subunit